MELDGIIPAPYMARHHWVGFERFDALPDRELKPLLRNAYQMVLEKLPKKIRAQLDSPVANTRKQRQPRQKRS